MALLCRKAGVWIWYNTIHRTILLNCSIADTDEQALEKAQQAGLARNTGGAEYLLTRALIGTPETIRKRLNEYEQIDAQEVILFFPDSKELTPLRRFANEILDK